MTEGDFIISCMPDSYEVQWVPHWTMHTFAHEIYTTHGLRPTYMTYSLIAVMEQTYIYYYT